MSVTIQKMTATFGALDRAELIPGDGLTVITAPNESGKSTWVAFLKAMFYGIDTKERDKAGYLAEKNRYQPWSGAPMSGEIRLTWDGKDITLRRTTNRSGPMQQFEAVFTASGDPVPGLTAANAGQQLLGVSKEVFTRSALVGQSDTAVTSNPELERRVAALATSGEEDVSASAAQRTLKDWHNRRYLNKSKGLIPELTAELHEAEQTLRDLDLARIRREEAQQQLQLLAEQRKSLTAEQELHSKLAAKELNRRCGEALERLQTAERDLAELPPHDPVFDGMTAPQARELVASLQAQAEENRILREQNSVRRDIERRHRTVMKQFKLVVPLLGILGLLALIVGFVIRIYPMAFAGVGVMMLAVVALILFAARIGKLEKQISRLASQEVPEEDIPLPDAEAYARWLIQRDALQREVRHCRERYEDLTAQGGQPLNTLELLPQPRFSAAETAARLSAADRESARWQTQLDQAIGALRSDPLELEARCGQLETCLEQRTAELEAIDLAMSVLDSANTALRERFSPTLNHEAAELFSALTGGKYTALTLSRDFSAMAGAADTHSALYLSAGTVDQLYLAVRLALCRLTVPGTPIVLDDALCAFDDARMALALETLKELGRERQILLFSCHSREAAWCAQHSIPTRTLP